jgi:hypothetical protein
MEVEEVEEAQKEEVEVEEAQEVEEKGAIPWRTRAFQDRTTAFQRVLMRQRLMRQRLLS